MYKRRQIKITLLTAYTQASNYKRCASFAMYSGGLKKE
jgi:hypothetical protein